MVTLGPRRTVVLCCRRPKEDCRCVIGDGSVRFIGMSDTGMNEAQHIDPLSAGPCAHAEINMPGQVEKAVGTGSRPGLRDSLIMKDQAAPSQRLAGLVSIVIPCYNGAAFLAEAI